MKNIIRIVHIHKTFRVLHIHTRIKHIQCRTYILQSNQTMPYDLCALFHANAVIKSPYVRHQTFFFHIFSLFLLAYFILYRLHFVTHIFLDSRARETIFIVCSIYMYVCVHCKYIAYFSISFPLYFSFMVSNLRTYHEFCGD